MSTLPFYEPVAGDFAAVNQLILDQLHSRVPLVEKIGHYIISAGGKRLRPLVVLLSARACGADSSEQHSLAAIIEFLHTATLLHDDVVDASDLRRGLATANAVWGNKPSVLVGDFLFSRAFQLMTADGSLDVLRILSNDLKASAQEIADLYKRRWAIELFFRWVKQTLKIRHFLGTSENAVRIQIAVALITYLLLSLAKADQSVAKGLLEFTRLVRINLMHRRRIDRLKAKPTLPPTNTSQMAIQWN